jgi:hypothetical protein
LVRNLKGVSIIHFSESTQHSLLHLIFSFPIKIKIYFNEGCLEIYPLCFLKRPDIILKYCLTYYTHRLWGRQSALVSLLCLCHAWMWREKASMAHPQKSESLPIFSAIFGSSAILFLWRFPNKAHDVLYHEGWISKKPLLFFFPLLTSGKLSKLSVPQFPLLQVSGQDTHLNGLLWRLRVKCMSPGEWLLHDLTICHFSGNVEVVNWSLWVYYLLGYPFLVAMENGQLIVNNLFPFASLPANFQSSVT